MTTAAARHPIPPMMHELGRYWEQPDRSEIEVDGTHALMSPAAFYALSDYSSSNPSGVYEGKMWVRWRIGVGPLLCWYEALPLIPGRFLIKTRRILVV